MIELKGDGSYILRATNEPPHRCDPWAISEVSCRRRPCCERTDKIDEIKLISCSCGALFRPKWKEDDFNAYLEWRYVSRWGFYYRSLRKRGLVA